jgi:hypothetical protein
MDAHKVRALQWILTHSYSAKVLAVHRVKTKGGKHPEWMGSSGKPTNRKRRLLESLRGKDIRHNH